MGLYIRERDYSGVGLFRENELLYNVPIALKLPFLTNVTYVFHKTSLISGDMNAGKLP